MDFIYVEDLVKLMDRRAFLASGAAFVSAGFTGCIHGGPETADAGDGDGEVDGGFDREENPQDLPPVYGDRPDAVYHPTHTEGMDHVSSDVDGSIHVALMYSYPERFWTISGGETNQVDILGGDDVHLMASVWEPDSGVVLPAQVDATVYEDGDEVTSTNLWHMLGQNMGFHYGDNVGLGGDGDYTVELSVTPENVEWRRGFTDGFDLHSVELELPYREAERNLIYYEMYGDEVGSRTALEPMDMHAHGDHTHGHSGHPGLSFAPDVAELDGVDGVVGVAEQAAGDASLVLAAYPAGDFGGEEDEEYLAVLPRTPYNGYTLPMASASAEVEGETVELRQSVDPELDVHYGAFVDGFSHEDLDVTVEFGVPPQLARHEGYETAFLDMQPVSTWS